MSGIVIGFTAFTSVTDIPDINPQVNDVLATYNATLERKGESGKYIQLLISFSN
jgi:hypothetical protein